MIISHDFNCSLMEYAEKGKENNFPTFERCPGCQCFSQGSLHRNGYYFRYAILHDDVQLIPICRFRCLSCKINISILPDFLVPYFQPTLQTIIERVHWFLQDKKVSDSRQHLSQLVKRFLKCLRWIHSFFNSLGYSLGLTDDNKKEAQKYMKMILDFGESTFFRRSWGHLSSYFMGTLILPYLST